MTKTARSGFFTRRVAIDLGTANTVVMVPKQGIIANEPSVVAINAGTDEIVAIGEEAKQMLGRTPDSIVAAHPLKEGVIANYRITEAMIGYYLTKIYGRIRLIRPDVMVAVPAGVTSTERRAVIDATVAAGARAAYLIKEPIAAALGAGLDIADSSGNMIIDIGGGTTEIAVIALGDTVAVNSVRVAGTSIDSAICNYVRKKFNLTIGMSTAETVKLKIGAVMTVKKERSLEVSGSNTVTGLPESILLHTTDVVKAIRPPITEIINAVKVVLQHTPPELAADVMEKGIILTGGGALLENIDELFTKVTGVPCQIAEDPMLCVARGTLKAVENLDAFKRSVLWAKK